MSEVLVGYLPPPDFMLPGLDGVPHRFLARERDHGFAAVSVTYPRMRDVVRNERGLLSQAGFDSKVSVACA